MKLVYNKLFYWGNSEGDFGVAYREDKKFVTLYFNSENYDWKLFKEHKDYYYCDKHQISKQEFLLRTIENPIDYQISKQEFLLRTIENPIDFPLKNCYFKNFTNLLKKEIPQAIK